MAIGVARAQIGELRLELFQFLVDRRQPVAVCRPDLLPTLQRPVLVGQRLQINLLLPGGIEGIFFVLQLGLHALQNLQVARQLSRHLADVLRL